ncbi:TetR/AcrR family transcriptional regulator [Kineococcus sp. SYSU DK006]|uniref:TetR/AcrR family transcriptional regulator n=1 Tax=Kineococcus sp. SYSU DK006 TaxID=3383127 RepID=UPI003D7F03AC
MVSTTPRARVRKDPAERAQEILAAARAVAARDGLTALTLRSVAREADVAPSLVAHYFPEVEALVAEVFGALAQEEESGLRAELAQVADAGERLRHLLDWLPATDRAGMTALWLEALVLGRRNARLAERAREDLGRWQSLVREEIAAAAAAGAAQVEDPADAAARLLAFSDGINEHALVGYEEPALRVRFREVGEQVLRMRPLRTR